MLRLPLVTAVAVLAVSVAMTLVGQVGAATTMVTTNSATLKFEPSTVTIAVGDTVMWMGVSGHTVTSNSSNWSFNTASDASFNFMAPGTYTYFCQVHGPSMNGEVIVQGADGATNTPTSTQTVTSTPGPNSPTVSPTATSATGPSAGTLVALLTGAGEVPPTSSTGTASVTLRLDGTAGTVIGTWNATGLTSNIVGAHVHRGGAGTNGGIEIPFSGVPAAGGSFSTSDVASLGLIREILANPGGFYVNVHTANNTGGEVRGQLQGAATCATGTLGAGLLPSNERPPVVAGATGDVTLAFNEAAGTIEGSWNVSGPTSGLVAAHIHQNATGANGPVVVPFSPIPSAGGRFVTTTTSVSPHLIANILANPSAFYVNVHTDQNLGGETRGQLGCVASGNKVYLPLVPRNAGAD
jgi:plastocyanin/Cu/Zn superoxide dismutase